uniref:MLO-like protein n=1 Tax=Lactuca sativa TaxID=4236 RepID=A0A9R1VLH9_LACSA|nr:hypothetical protein LSAT_V11C500293250 [Lactuca sativa]
MAGGLEGTSFEFTPTWVVAALCTVIVGISIAVERLLHYTGEKLKKADQKPLFEALQKIKEELMLLGFISLLLTVFQSKIIKICVNKSIVDHLLPCSLSERDKLQGTSHLRHLLAEETTAMGYCALKEKVPLLSLEALHHLHIFIFILAVVHVTFSVITVIFGEVKMREWERWEESITEDDFDTLQVLQRKVSFVEEADDFFKNRFLGIGGSSAIRGWLHSFFKQFYWSVTKSDYVALRLGFITLLLAVGTKLEHIIIQLAYEVSEKHIAEEGHKVLIEPKDDHFWFNQPRILLFLMHFILFQNSFEIAFLFWIWLQFGFDSCIMGKLCYIIPRLIIGVFIQVLCSYSTLPLYALLTQMGTNFKSAIFAEHIKPLLMGWAKDAKKRVAHSGGISGSSSAVELKASVDHAC